ncbi:KH domain-containing protein At4g18375 isoform X2 [Amborella trichopoda]|nr:KH domain-containing protein At4g18375 isoform X2 [Amborella trichopoda]|eukprot:XP_020518638.1 KH domain-containing protein At4g18375 isoform X2 [Amborella trichopoda]
MYRFSPKEEIPLGSEVHDVAPTVIIPSDMPIYPSGGYYPSVDSIVPPRSAAPVIGATHHMEGLTGFSSDLGSAYSLYSSALPVAPGYGVSSRTEELTVKVLCPTDKIGRVIGKGGGSIKSVRQSTGARVDVEDAKDDCDECVIIVASTESNGDSRSPAVEAVLLLQGKINDNSDEDESVTMRLLVPSKVVGCLIGRGGAIITEMRKKTKADIRISKGDKPKCCASNEELVETSGEVSCVRDALVQIILRLREDVLRDKEGDQAPSEPLYSGSLSTYSSLPGGPSAAPFSYDQRHDTGSGLGMLHTGGLRGYGSLTVGENGYGSALSSYSSKPYGGLSSTSLELVIPAHAVGKVMGKGGANITNIRKISGATIEVLDGKTRNGDRLAHISGTTEQKSLAENLIQAFIMST